MELKTYQKQVLAELRKYLESVAASSDVDAAWKLFWNEHGVPVTSLTGGGMCPYSDDISGVPNACIKVPTGGGKTFIAATTATTDIPSGLCGDSPNSARRMRRRARFHRRRLRIHDQQTRTGDGDDLQMS